MGRWMVEYQGADEKPKRTWVDVPDELKTARDVHGAICRGEIGDLFVPADKIALVEEYRPIPMA